MLTIQSQIKDFITPARLRGSALALAATLAVLAVWWLAQLTWQLLTPTAAVVAGSYNQAPVAQVQTLEINSIKQLKLFGDREQEARAQSEQIDAPQTTLNISLVGLTASGNQLLSAAIIEQGGNQQTYIIGERIANSRATLEAVFSDRVILDNSGRREALYLEGRDGYEAQLQVQQSTPAPGRRETQSEVVNLEENEELSRALSAVRENPTELLEFINISPISSDGQITGYRLQPRQDSELFAAVGLQPGDIAIAINGYDLTDTAQAMAAMSEIQDAASAIVQVRRNDDIIDLELRVPSQQ
ncbi:type II secretion system protein GspC [Aliidiomarina minuta]|uniref:type II secretion system protein GspC n=1 Tax=Aliidiomarina minuta TaxID=880057 RepID=UPI0018E58C6C|nr:type II secretion system protein GspC [Aliidiomarina minuta]